MIFERAAGVLLHPTSLPGPYGIGDLGYEAFRFIDFLKDSKQKLWQVLPLGPTGYGDSPYQCFSAFAGNPLLINPDLLIEEKLLKLNDIHKIPHFDASKVDFGPVIDFKYSILEKSYVCFKEKYDELKSEYELFCESNSEWLNDYALFMACKKHFDGKIWAEWDEEIAFRKPGAIEKWNNKLSELVNFQKYIQFMFSRQWQNIKTYANNNKIKIIGDLPIYVSYDSSDVWAARHNFSVDEHGKLINVAGVPPDYFSPTGQLWGNPLYNWEEMKKDNYSWWITRFKKLFEIVDIARIDHFRGFEAYYSVPGKAKTAEKGVWVKAPGKELFEAVKHSLGDLPIIAEDLGVITQEVDALRTKFKFPGMKIMQFSFGKNGEIRFLPHNFENNTVVYTGSHDNETTKGFFDREKELKSEVYLHAQKYLHYHGEDLRLALIRAAYSSVANTVIIPLQDILNIGNEGRMNFPGKPSGNWGWRFLPNAINSHLAHQFADLTGLYQR